MKAEQVIEKYLSIKNPNKAKLLSGFFKTGKGQYGEGDLFLGITVPQTRNLTKEYKELPLPEVKKLLKNPYHEIRLFAVLLLVLKYKSEPEIIYKLYCQNFKWVNNWDLVDLSAPNIVGDYLQNHSTKAEQKKTILNFLETDHLWTKRIAILATFTEIKSGETKLPFEIFTHYLRQIKSGNTIANQDLMHKAVGWMLREAYKRADANATLTFLEKEYANLPRTTLRYAIERVPEVKRKKILQGIFS